MTAIIRPAVAADSPALLRLIVAHAEYEGGKASVTVVELTDLLAAEDAPAHLIVAESPDGLLGYAAVTFDWSVWRGRRYGHLDCLYVSSDVRGLGVGKQLLDEAARLAARQGADRLEWQTPDWNEGAIRFYRREGASELTKQRFSLMLPAEGEPEEPGY